MTVFGLGVHMLALLSWLPFCTVGPNLQPKVFGHMMDFEGTRP